MQTYLNLLKHVLENGKEREDRTGVGTLSVFGYQARYDLRNGFPICTTKKLHWKSIFWELMWFLGGHTNVNWLEEKGVTIWSAWKLSDGTIGPGYGAQLRGAWHKNNTHDREISFWVDQVLELIRNLREDPFSRRHLLSSWNPDAIDSMALAPCHPLSQFYVSDGELSCHLYQRSGDAFLGVPFNIASYALLTHLLAAMTGLKVGEFIHSFGDLHIYKNHIEQVKLQLTRTPKPLPKLEILRIPEKIEDFVIDDVRIVGYEPDPNIKAKVAV